MGSSIPERAGGVLRSLAAALTLGIVLAGSSAAQDLAGDATESRRVAGRVLTPGDTSMLPVVGAWVTLHRIGFDRAGPVDSVRTGRQGQYAITYRAALDDSATYTVSTMHAGIAHFSASFADPVVAGDAAEIVVFDTTSAPVPLHVRGRHLVVFAAEPGETRRVLEVHEIENDGPKTALARDGVVPVWRASLPAEARNVRVDDESLPKDAVRIADREVQLLAPLTPGIRQLAIRYELPASAFPLELRLREPVDLLEVLVEEPFARVAAPGLEEVDRAETEGHVLRRFLARNADSGLVVRVELPTASRRSRAPAIAIIVGGTALVLAISLALALRRPRTASSPMSAASLVERGPAA